MKLRHLLLAASLVAMTALVVFLPAVWDQAVTIHSKQGGGLNIPRAARGLILTGVGLGLYVGAELRARRRSAQHDPAEGPDFAHRLVSAIGLVAIWVAIAVTIPR